MLTAYQEAVIIEERRRSALQRIRRQYPQFIAEADPVSGGYIVRNAKIPGRAVLVDPDGVCNCRRYRLFDLCKHAAAVARLEEQAAHATYMAAEERAPSGARIVHSAPNVATR